MQPRSSSILESLERRVVYYTPKSAQRDFCLIMAVIFLPRLLHSPFELLAGSGLINPTSELPSVDICEVIVGDIAVGRVFNRHEPSLSFLLFAARWVGRS